MDATQIIERNIQALRRILLTLVAMANLPVLSPADRPTIPRHLRNAVLRLLRPAESAARRLIVAAGCGLAVTLPASRPRALAPKKPPLLLRGGKGTGLVLPWGARFAAGATGGRPDLRRPDLCRPVLCWPAAPRRFLALPLLDPLRPPKNRRRWVRQATIPRISVPGFGAVHPVAPRPVPMPGDRLDATRLALRLDALGRALGDLPGEAQRFARWRARRDSRLARERAGGTAAKNARRRWTRLGPLRPGRPPGARNWTGRLSGRPPGRQLQEVHDILDAAHSLAVRALASHDTS